MIRRLASIAVLSLPLSLLSTGSASAADCGALALVGGCAAPAPSPSSSTQPAPQPSSSSPSSPQPAAAPAPAPAPARTISEVPGAAERLMELVNAERTSRNMVVLTVRSDVVAIAHPHSSDMASKRTIWHNDGYFTASTKASLRSAARGENVAMNSTSLQDAHVRLMNSPGHRANILNGGFTQAGISVVQDEAGTLYVTENFMTPQGAPKATRAKSSTASKAKISKKRSTRARGARRARTARPTSR
ncbi:MAG TPA: CAP domain-containing protein [Acidimicrobiales bacterium]|nr:CAP domain-containing protein [Acidimicrobiales bacterium]